MAEPRGIRGRRSAAGAGAALIAACFALAAQARAQDPDLEQGYAIQQRETERQLASGRSLAGYKAAFTGAAAQRAFGVTGPVYGPLFADMRVASGGEIHWSDYAALRAEVELAFEIGTPVAAPFDAAALRRAVRALHVALDLADLRLAGKPTAAALVASGVGARHYALGPPRALEGLEPAALRCALEVDGELFTSGAGSDALGDPWRALEWLVAEQLRRGGRIDAGAVILTGALGQVYAPRGAPPRDLAGRCEQLGEVRVRVVSSPASP